MANTIKLPSGNTGLAIVSALLVLSGILSIFFSVDGVLMKVLVGVFGGFLVLISWKTKGPQRAAGSMPFFLVLIVLTVIAEPDAFGQATFGARWPAVQESIQNAIAPIALQFGGISETYRTGFDCLVDPIGCQRQFTPQTQGEGSVLAVELVGFEMNGPSSLQLVCEDRTIFVTIKNFADRTAKDVKITPFAPKDIDNSNAPAGSYEITNCGKGTVAQDKKSCTVSELFEGESLQMAVKYSIDLKSSGSEVRGHRVQLRAGIEYAFDVSGSLDVVIANSTYYDFLASQGQLARQTVSTRDTGGPVRLGLAIFNNEMPIRGGIDSTPVLLLLRDQSNGYIKSIESASINASGIGTPASCDQTAMTTALNGHTEIRNSKKYADLTEETQEVRDTTCSIDLLDPQSQETQTSSVRAEVRYWYGMERFQNVFVDLGAGDYCKCTNGDSFSGSTAEGGNLSCSEFCSDKGGVAGC